MQQEIKLTNESSNTVFVDDVDVSNGVYAINKPGSTFYIGKYEGRFYATKSDDFVDLDLKRYNTYSSLKELISSFSGYTFYTIPENKRIVTEHEVTIEDLKNTDHVGILDVGGGKGYITHVGFNSYKALLVDIGSSGGCNHFWNEAFDNFQDLLKYLEPQVIIRFTTRKELYQWLAE